jgi:hypothetical protein
LLLAVAVADLMAVAAAVLADTDLARIRLITPLGVLPFKSGRVVRQEPVV